MQVKHPRFVFLGFFLCTLSSISYSHGLIEAPSSREYFCGKITKPEHIYAEKLPHEECRPIITIDGKMNDTIYQFMSVLSHSRGYYHNANLPKNVCSFNDSTSPWDAAINWPVNNIQAGSKEFTWDISYGPHFSDTEHFRYWITKPDYKFVEGKALQWNDLELEPFCQIEWDDRNPNKDTSVIRADKINNKFHMTCNVPQRQGRHIIYAEWGRTESTNERFHSCIDVQYSTAQTETLTAKIASLTNQFYGEGTLELNGSQSVGKNLKYQWSVNSTAMDRYTLTNATQPIATLALKNLPAQTDILVTLTVTDGQSFAKSDAKITHYPLVTTEWNELGKLTNEAITLKIGDKVVIRAVGKDGKDIYYPEQPLIITSQTTAVNEWPYALAQAVNVNQDGLRVGYISQGDTVPQPMKHETNNKIYIKTNNNIQNAYLEIQTAQTGACQITVKEGSSAWWVGFEVASDLAQFNLDFSQSGLDLSKVTLDKGVFEATLQGQIVKITKKPEWMKEGQTGYFGFNANNYPALTKFNLPSCK